MPARAHSVGMRTLAGRTSLLVRTGGVVTYSGLFQLGASTVIFVLAASAAKGWTITPSHWRLLLVLALYSAGNLIMLRLIREFGMGVALSLSAVIQLVAVNLVAFLWFGEKVETLQGLGILAAIAAIGLITVGPYISAR
jgi:hypothetical protein